MFKRKVPFGDEGWVPLDTAVQQLGHQPPHAYHTSLQHKQAANFLPKLLGEIAIDGLVSPLWVQECKLVLQQLRMSELAAMPHTTHSPQWGRIIMPVKAWRLLTQLRWYAQQELMLEHGIRARFEVKTYVQPIHAIRVYAKQTTTAPLCMKIDGGDKLAALYTGSKLITCEACRGVVVEQSLGS